LEAPYDGRVSQDSPQPTTVCSSASRPSTSFRGKASSREGTACATQILTTLARRAYRRAPTNDDIQTLVRFYQEARAATRLRRGAFGGTSQMVLVSPDFLFRIAADPASVAAPGTALSPSRSRARVAPVGFSSEQHPDDELLDTAIRWKLHEQL
jgi:hypothetical protein